MSPLWFTVGVPFVTSIFGAFLAVQLALSRFYREKWWEKKLATYISALEAIHSLRFVYAEWQDAFLDRRTVSDDERRELQKKRREGEADVRRVIDVGEFLVTTEAVEALEHFWREMFRALAAETDPVDEYGKCCDVADDALAKLRVIAKADLKLKPWLPWPQAN